MVPRILGAKRCESRVSVQKPNVSSPSSAARHCLRGAEQRHAGTKKELDCILESKILHRKRLQILKAGGFNSVAS